MPAKSGGVVNYNQKFIDTMEHFDVFLQERLRTHPQIWVDRIPKGALSNYEGLTRKTNIFHGGLGEQAGLTNWSKIQVSRVAAGEDQGYDACAYDPKQFTYAVEAKDYTGYRCSWQSDPICINDIRFVAEARQQCAMIVNFMTFITQSVWENWNRENYVKMAVDAGNAFILTEGGMDYADSPTARFTYNPYLEDADGDTYITYPSTIKPSTLNWSFFDWWQDYLGDECPEAQVANMDGLSVFGLMLHKRDFNRMVMGDDDLREDLRFAKSSVLIEDYRSFKEFKGWALIHDSRQMRFKIKSDNGTTTIAKRVKPMKNGRAVTIGNVPVADPDYVKAELAVGVVFMNNVIQNLIPTPISNQGSGMVFGAQPGYDGTFKWINKYDKDENPLEEVGYFFARFEAFPKPLMYSGEAIVFLYLRAPQTQRTVPAIVQSTEAATSGDVSVATAAVSADVDLTNFTVKLKLASLIAKAVGETVTLVNASSGSYTAKVADSSDAPTYTFVLSSAPSAYTTWTTSAKVSL